MTGITVSGLTAGYGQAPVLCDLSLSITSGEVIAVLGASGSGKTTLLRVLAGFLKPQAGAVHFGERLIAGDGVYIPPERRRIGMMPQEGALFPHLTVAQNIGFGLPRGSDARIDELLELVGMRGLGDRRPQQLSGGQQQRVALARALAPGPELLCLDEPFSSLDAALRTRLRTEVSAVLRDTGTTTVLVTHDQEEALSIADRVALLRDGRLVQFDAPEVLYARPADLQTARFVGDVVELEATIADTGHAVTALGALPLVEKAPIGAHGTLALRPEQLSLVAAHPVGVHAPAPPVGHVHDATFHGHDSMAHIRLTDGTAVLVRVPGGTRPALGQAVGIAVHGPGLFYPTGSTPDPEEVDR